VGETINWLVIIVSAIFGFISGLISSYLTYSFTYKKELKKIDFQGINSGKQELYPKIKSELKEIKEAASLSNEPNKPTRQTNESLIIAMSDLDRKSLRFSNSKDNLDKHLVKLELIAPKGVIENTKILIESLSLRNDTKLDSIDKASLDKLDEEIKEKCDQLTSILREDLGAID